MNEYTVLSFTPKYLFWIPTLFLCSHLTQTQMVRGPYAGLLDVLVDGLDGPEASPHGTSPCCPREMHEALFTLVCLLGQALENKSHFATNTRALKAIAGRVSVHVPPPQASLAAVCLAQLLHGSGGERVKVFLKKACPGLGDQLKSVRQAWSARSFLSIRNATAVVVEEGGALDAVQMEGLMNVVQHISDALELDLTLPDPLFD